MSEHEPNTAGIAAIASELALASERLRNPDTEAELREVAEEVERTNRAELEARLFPQSTEAEPTIQRIIAAADEIAEKDLSDEDAAATLKAAMRKFRPARSFADLPEPEAVIRREGMSGAVLRRGEVAILAGQGGMGKSFLTLRFALAAADGCEKAVCGMRITEGPVLLSSYEDDPSEIARRLGRMREADNEKRPLPDNLLIREDAVPLFTADPKSHGKVEPDKAGWNPLWREVEESKPVLVIIDPAKNALADVSASEAGAVAKFLAEVAKNAKRFNCGVLIVAHDTKAARNAVATGGDPMSGVVSGSAAWTDSARSVLYFWKSPRHFDARTGKDSFRILECVKANYTATGWSVLLAEETIGDRNIFAGFKFSAFLNSDELEEAKRPLPKPKVNANEAKYDPTTERETEEPEEEDVEVSS